MGKDKKNKSGKGKGKKGGKKGKKGGKKGKKGMSTGKKVAIGAGVAALAIGGLCVGKYLYDKNKAKNNGPHRGGAFDTSDGPIDPALAPYTSFLVPEFYKASVETHPIPDTISAGLGWAGQSNLDLLGAVYNYQGQNIGYISGQSKDLFQGALTHTGDDASGNMSSVFGDNENIVCDFSKLPNDAASVVFGALTLSGVPSKAYLHVCPLIRESAVGHRGIIEESESESDDSGSEGEEEFGTRGVNPDGSFTPDEDEHSFLTFFHGEPTQYQDFLQNRAYVAGKAFKGPTGSWYFQPIRTVVPADPNYGIWPALEHYARLQSPAPRNGF